jgi:hypothetical protein
MWQEPMKKATSSMDARTPKGLVFCRWSDSLPKVKFGGKLYVLQETVIIIKKLCQ